ncbi:ABC transporter permease [Cytobacillus purgationiresistens]|uniref:ABC-2 type transport system permease protein n=1 Tax=Cytobacillus purgationiresistens TaxID=863449 RepID=A0ABU0AR61_9BACI|nr:ABC transporter permease [Cytobacillus purgationiresistens]MDQ0273700.1 ABC-2 type transport system permease protein [Cytobacillus purgationiresistens]
MSQWLILLQKELLENVRNFKWIWVPLVFIILAIQQPITMYYMPQILESVGGLPEGAVFDFPVPSAEEVLATSLTQYNSLGVLIIVLITMGVIAAERKSGVAAMILVKPVSYTSFVTSKWFSVLLLVWASYFIGYLGAWYYTGVLFEFVSFSIFMQSFLMYGVWLTFVLTFTVFLNTFLKSSGLIAFISLGSIIIMSLISSILSNALSWSPALLGGYVTEFIMFAQMPDGAVISMVVSIAVIGIMLLLSVLLFRKNELAE